MDQDMVLRGFGPALAKACPDLVDERPVKQYFKIITPNIKQEFETICLYSHTVFFLEHNSGKLTLKGEMLETLVDGNRFIIFLCSPVIQELGEVAEFGLSLNDFAIHDSTVDLLVLLQTKNSIINDTTRMADRLKQEVKVRQGAEKALREANEILEDRVDTRTMELKKANKKLQMWIDQLEQRNNEIAILNSLGETLQGCVSVDDTQDVVFKAMKRLFPESTGKIAYYNKRTDRFETHLQWGDEIECFDNELLQEECSALKCGKMLACDSRYAGSMCKKMRRQPDQGSVCNPLIVKEKMVGLIHLQYTLDQFESDIAEKIDDQSLMQLKLIQAASDQISLAVTNLHLQEELRDQALIDPLTGLFNRRQIDYSLDREISRAKRKNSTIAMIMIDVDHFKRFNDQHGHQVGDLVLKALGKLLKKNVRGEDIASRFGGEEFMLILPDASSENAVERAEEIKHRLQHDVCVQCEGRKIEKVTASFGVAVFPQDAVDGAGLIAAADKALYHAKALGRNRIELAGS